MHLFQVSLVEAAQQREQVRRELEVIGRYVRHPALLQRKVVLQELRSIGVVLRGRGTEHYALINWEQQVALAVGGGIVLYLTLCGVVVSYESIGRLLVLVCSQSTNNYDEIQLHSKRRGDSPGCSQGQATAHNNNNRIWM